MVTFLHLSIPTLFPLLSLKLLTIFFIDTSWLSFAAKSMRLSMNKRCEIMSPWGSSLYPMLLVFNSRDSGSNDRMESNPDGLFPWKMPVLTENDQFYFDHLGNWDTKTLFIVQSETDNNFFKGLIFFFFFLFFFSLFLDTTVQPSGKMSKTLTVFKSIH